MTPFPGSVKQIAPTLPSARFLPQHLLCPLPSLTVETTLSIKLSHTPPSRSLPRLTCFPFTFLCSEHGCGALPSHAFISVMLCPGLPAFIYFCLLGLSAWTGDSEVWGPSHGIYFSQIMGMQTMGVLFGEAPLLKLNVLTFSSPADTTD